MRIKEAEMYAALTAPVNQANYALDDEHPLQMYECLIPAIKLRKHANPYDTFPLDVINNWHKVALDNNALKS